MSIAHIVITEEDIPAFEECLNKLYEMVNELHSLSKIGENGEPMTDEGRQNAIIMMKTTATDAFQPFLRLVLSHMTTTKYASARNTLQSCLNKFGKNLEKSYGTDNRTKNEIICIEYIIQMAQEIAIEAFDPLLDQIPLRKFTKKTK